MHKALLESKNLAKKFDDFFAVDQINFSVNKSKIFGLLGPNGGGAVQN
jgi:ABC-2 type transport system ATP-binding protein